MVVRLVLEQVQPVLLFAVHVALDLHGAGVDFLGFVEVFQNAFGLEPFGADGAHVHEADGLFVAAELMAHGQILLEGGLHGFVVDLHVLEHRAERGVAAVVGPVGVDHLDFGDGGVALLVFGEILLAEGDVGGVHGKAALGDERGKARLVELAEAFDHLDGARRGLLHLQRLARCKRCLARLDGVDDIAFDRIDVGVGQLAFQNVYLGAQHLGALALADQLDAFARGCRALVELAGQRLDGEHGALRVGQLGERIVRLRFAEHGGHALLEQLVACALDVVAVDETDARERLDAKNALQLVQKLLRLHIEAGLLLNVDTRNHWFPAFPVAR